MLKTSSSAYVKLFLTCIASHSNDLFASQSTRRFVLADHPNRGQAVANRHLNVHQSVWHQRRGQKETDVVQNLHDIDFRLGLVPFARHKDVQSDLAVFGCRRSKPTVRQLSYENFGINGIVFDDQDMATLQNGV